MSIATVRGGIPHVTHMTIDSTGRYFQFFGTSCYIMFRTGLKQLKVYFTEADFDADTNYLGPYNEWEGPVEANGCWLKGDGGDCDVIFVEFERRA